MRAVNSIRDEEGFTIIELLTALGIGAIAAALVFSVYVQLNRYFTDSSLRNEFRQAVQLVKSVLETKVRYAVEVGIVDSTEIGTQPNWLYLDKSSHIVYAADGQVQILAGDGDLDFSIQFENRDPMLFFRITATGPRDNVFEFEMQILLLEAEFEGGSGPALYYVID